MSRDPDNVLNFDLENQSLRTTLGMPVITKTRVLTKLLKATHSFSPEELKLLKQTYLDIQRENAALSGYVKMKARPVQLQSPKKAEAVNVNWKQLLGDSEVKSVVSDSQRAMPWELGEDDQDSIRIDIESSPPPTEDEKSEYSESVGGESTFEEDPAVFYEHIYSSWEKDPPTATNAQFMVSAVDDRRQTNPAAIRQYEYENPSLQFARRTGPGLGSQRGRNDITSPSKSPYASRGVSSAARRREPEMSAVASPSKLRAFAPPPRGSPGSKQVMSFPSPAKGAKQYMGGAFASPLGAKHSIGIKKRSSPLGK